MNAKQMREKRGALVEQMQGMVAAAKAEGRNLSNEENEKFEKKWLLKLKRYAKQHQLRR